jgi:hypothetical protein
MSLHSWLQNLRSALAPGRGQLEHARRGSARGPTHRPNLEALEDRSVPAFLAPIDYAAGARPNAVVTADFNGDGRLDLATANHDSNSVSILLGNGDGTFQTPRIFTTSGSPVWIEAGDFNGDGKLDLVTGNELVSGYHEIGTLLGNGDGSFQWIGSTLIGYQAGLRDAAVGDFNADGKLDVAMSIVYVPFDASVGAVVVWLGDGNGFFASNSYLGVYGDDYLSIVAADFNRDGYTDLAWADPYAAPAGAVEVSLSLGTDYYGQAYFDSEQFYALDGGTWALAVADLNGDGKPDLVTNTGMLQGHGDGTFQLTQYYTWGGLVGDFNGDGSLDLLAGNNLLPGSGNDAGTFPAASGYSTLGDFNGDARWDTVSVNYSASSVSVQLNDGIWDGPPTPLPPSLRINDSFLMEGNVGSVAATFTLTLSVPSAEPITVSYATADGSATAGSDYQASSGTLTFAPDETEKTITVLVNGDRLGEPTETFFVNLSSPTNAVIADGQGLGTIMDDEPRLSITPFVSHSEGNTGQTPFYFPVTLSFAYDAPVTVDWATGAGNATAGSDYQAASGTLTFAPNETTKTITILVNGDRLFEPTETFFVNLSAPTNAGIAAGQGVGSITDDEPRISINDVTAKEGKKNQTTQLTFTVTLSAAYDQAVTMSFRTVDGTAKTSDNDYVARTGTLTFNPGETTKTITITVNGDRTKEPDETFSLDLFGLSSNALFTRSRGLGTILNDD